jgi:hypothetical protein
MKCPQCGCLLQRTVYPWPRGPEYAYPCYNCRCWWTDDNWYGFTTPRLLGERGPI